MDGWHLKQFVYEALPYAHLYSQYILLLTYVLT